MKRIFLLLEMLLFVAAVSAVAADSANLKPSAPAAAVTNAPIQPVITHYFHGPVRCETCLKIGQQAREVIERQFKPERDAQRLVFKSVNYDLPENAHFLLDYKLPCPSLVLVRQKDGNTDQRMLLGDTWQLVENPVKFKSYTDIKTKCAQGLDDCAHNNPQGSCCLGNVQRVIREATGTTNPRH